MAAVTGRQSEHAIVEVAGSGWSAEEQFWRCGMAVGAHDTDTMSYAPPWHGAATTTLSLACLCGVQPIGSDSHRWSHRSQCCEHVQLTTDVACKR